MKPVIALIVLLSSLIVLGMAFTWSAQRPKDPLLFDLDSLPKIYLDHIKVLTQKDTGNKFISLGRTDGSVWWIRQGTPGLITYNGREDTIHIYGAGWTRRMDFEDKKEAMIVVDAIKKVLNATESEILYKRKKPVPNK